MTRLALAALLACGCAKETPPLRVAAASDLADLFPALRPHYQRAGGGRVEFTFGASGVLAKQLAEGAPFDVFASANVAFAEQLLEAGVCERASVVPLGVGRLALLGDLAQARHIALANPEHAPYGLAAKQALERQGLWTSLQPRLVIAQSVRHALQLYDSGNVEAAFVARANVVTRDGGVQLVDDALHEPIRQLVMTCRGGRQHAGGARFVKLLATDEGRALLRAHGFDP